MMAILRYYIRYYVWNLYYIIMKVVNKTKTLSAGEESNGDDPLHAKHTVKKKNNYELFHFIGWAIG